MKTQKSFFITIISLLLISLIIPIVKAEETASKEETVNISYYTHIQDIGWEKEYIHKNGEQAGTTGRAKPLEALYIKAENLPDGITLKYRTHVRDIGWQVWKKNGEMTGTTGKAKSIEAIEIQLENTKEYTIQYRAHVKNIGWMSWVSDGEQAGTTGKGLPIEAIEIKIIKREKSVIYKAHVSYIGWMDWKANGELAGTTGKALPIEALCIDAIGYEDMQLEYQAHVQDIGWMNWILNGEQAGTTGKGKPMEALKLKIKNKDEYSIMYRTHVKDIGWQDWVRDGEVAGTTGKAKTIEAIEIKIVPKTDEMRVKMHSESPLNDISMYETTLNVKGWVMTSLDETKIDIKVDNKTVDNISELKRTQRTDIINTIEGYGGIEKNPTPGYELNVDFSKYGAGIHTLSIQVLSKEGKILVQETRKINVIGTYGDSGLKHKGDSRGSKLEYYKFGTGPNVLFTTFAVHGFEDKWNHDGGELVTIANNFYNRLNNGNYSDIGQKWTIYIFPEVNPDGRRHGHTNNGPGRTTLFSKAAGNQGIDINRSWQIEGVPYTIYTDSRNYNGTEGFQSYEAQALRDFMLSNQSANGQTILIDLHGWTNQLIGDEDICMNYYYPRFQNADRSALGRYGTGYLVNWARSTLRSTSANARSALIELPSNGINNHQDVLNYDLSNRYIDSAILMLRGISVPKNTKMLRSTLKQNAVIDISEEEQYKTTLAGIIKQAKPEESEIENIVSQKVEKNGIWISEVSREKMLILINTFTNQEYEIDEDGYLKVLVKSENKNSYDIAIENAINSDKEYVIDMTGNYYSIDHMTNTIENNPFEKMDAYQVYEYVEFDSKIAIILTSNKEQKLDNNQIIENLIGFFN